MDAHSLLLNSQFATLNAKVDALAELLSEKDRETFLNYITQNLAKIYEKYKSKMTYEEFEEFRKLCEEGLYRH